MDKIDQKILSIVQRDASLPVSEIASQVGLTQTPCWKRIQRLEDIGVIKRRVALLDAKMINAGLTVFVTVRTNRHDGAWLDEFSNAVEDMPEVVEFHRLAGDIDYLLRVNVPDMDAYDLFYKELIGRVALTDVTSSFSMETIKSTPELPLHFLEGAEPRVRQTAK